MLSEFVDECRRYSKLKHHRFPVTIYSITGKTISGVHVLPGSADTSFRRSGITNHHFIAYSLSNISAKNY